MTPDLVALARAYLALPAAPTPRSVRFARDADGMVWVLVPDESGRLVWITDLTVGATVTAPDWRPDKECGGGLHVWRDGGGDRGTATAGDRGTATAGDYGTATAGYGGTASAGLGGCINILWYDAAQGRYRRAVAEVDGVTIRAGVKYRVENGAFVEVA